MNRHPLVGICVAFALGILLDYSFNVPVPFLIVLTTISLLSFPVLLCLYVPFRFCVVSGFLLVIMSGAAYHHYSYSHYPVNHISRLATTEKTPAYVQGVVVSSPTFKQLTSKYSSSTVNQTSFLLSTEMIKNKDRWDKVSGTIRVSLYTNTGTKPPVCFRTGRAAVASQIKYGDKVELLGTISTPLPPSNPGQWDYRRYLQRQRPSITALMVITNPSNIKVLSRGNGNAFFAFVNFIKKRFVETINRCCTTDSSPIITAMTLGDRQNISDDVKDAFKKTGTIHFLAISGFHVGILVIAVHTLLRLLFINRRLSAGLMILFLVLYAVLTGMTPPTVRACLMASIYFSAILLNRRQDLLNSMAAAVLIILIRNPSELFNAGLQLSVLSVLGIVYTTNRIESVLWKETLLIEQLQAPEERSKFWFLRRYIRITLCASLSAWLALIPLLAHYFNIVTPFAPLLTIIIFPLICILVIGGLIILILGSIHPFLAIPFGYLIHYSNLILEWVVSFFASGELTFFYTPGQSWLWISVYYTMGILLIWYKEMKLRLAHVIILILVCGNIFIFSNTFGQRDKDLRLTCLSVGHGSAIFIEFPNGKNLLFDAGSHSRFDVGERIIAPFLWERGIKKIDLVVLSHEHADHINALPSLLERFRIDTVLTNPFFPQPDTGLSLNNTEAGLPRPYLLNDKGIKHFVVSSGTRINGFGSVELTVLGPPENSILSINDNSCVLRIGYAGKTVLLLADIEEGGIASLLNVIASLPHTSLRAKRSNLNGDFDNLKADIIQVPHHGSYIANTDKLINKVQPQYAFINSGAKTVSEKTLKEYLKSGIQVFQTHHSGAITVIIDRNGIINISTFLK